MEDNSAVRFAVAAAAACCARVCVSAWANAAALAGAARGTTLYCTVLHCTALYCTALYCTTAQVAFCPSVPWCGRAIEVCGDPYMEVDCPCGVSFCFRCGSKPHRCGASRHEAQCCCYHSVLQPHSVAAILDCCLPLFLGLLELPLGSISTAATAAVTIASVLLLPLLWPLLLLLLLQPSQPVHMCDVEAVA
jgi:hypothetical protein